MHLEKCCKSEKEKEKGDQMQKEWKCPGQCGLGNTGHENDQTEKRKTIKCPLTRIHTIHTQLLSAENQGREQTNDEDEERGTNRVGMIEHGK